MGTGRMKHAKWLKVIVSVVILAGLAVAAREYLSGDALIRAFREFNYWYAPFLVALGIAYTHIKGWRFVWLVRAVHDVPPATGMRAYWSAEAATLLPGGVAARAALLKEVDVPVHRSTAPIIMSSVLDQVYFILGSLVAALWYQQARQPSIVVLAVLGTLTAVYLLPGVRGAMARSADQLAQRFHGQDKWRDFLASMRRVTRPRLLLATLGVTGVSFLLKVITLDLCLRALGFALPYPALFFAFVLPTLLGRLSPVPAGVGLTEAGMVGFLVTNTNVAAEEALAASAIFRIVTVFLPALLGSLVYFFLWRGEREVTSTQASP